VKTHPLRADFLMLFAALIWGYSFVVQRQSLATIGPYLFTGLRFLIGAAVVATLSHWLKRMAPIAHDVPAQRAAPTAPPSWPWGPGAVLGITVAVSIATQQIGLAYTKVANAGFISSMYVVIVPLLSLAQGMRLRSGIVAGALCAAVGLYYLSGEHLALSFGDALELIGAVAISLQILLLGAFAQRHDSLTLALIQNLVCAIACLIAALALEPVRWSDIERSAWTLFYCGAISVGVGYAIQAIAQRDALPAHAAIIFSMEGVFAALAARIFIDERLSWHAIFGCALVIAGCMVSQIGPGLRRMSGSNAANSPSSGR
jgi:drug/metabolite transporter (DMT)-like permease